MKRNLLLTLVDPLENFFTLSTTNCWVEQKDFFCLKVHAYDLFMTKYILICAGEQDHKVPVHSATALSQGLFGLVGKMMLHAIIHYATGLPGLCKGVAEYLLTGDVNEALPSLTVEDVPDPEMRDIVEEVIFVVCYY